jgi:hypothetical protein
MKNNFHQDWHNNVYGIDRTQDIKKIQYQIKKDDVEHFKKLYQKALKSDKDMHNFKITINSHLRRLNFYKYSLNTFQFFLENDLVNLSNINPIGLANLPNSQVIVQDLYKKNPEMALTYIETTLSQTKNLNTDKAIVENMLKLTQKDRQNLSLLDISEDTIYYLFKNNYKSYFVLKELGFNFKQYFKNEDKQNFDTFFIVVYETLYHGKGAKIDKIMNDFKNVDMVYSKQRKFPFNDMNYSNYQVTLAAFIKRDIEKGCSFLKALTNLLTPTSRENFKTFINEQKILNNQENDIFNSLYESAILDNALEKNVDNKKSTKKKI